MNSASTIEFSSARYYDLPLTRLEQHFAVIRNILSWFTVAMLSSTAWRIARFKTRTVFNCPKNAFKDFNSLGIWMLFSILIRFPSEKSYQISKEFIVSKYRIR
jgi:hypothetical protein